MSSDVWLSVLSWTAQKNLIRLKKQTKRRKPSHLQQKSTHKYNTHFVLHKWNVCMDWVHLYLCISEEQIPGALLGRKDFWRKMFKSQSAASDTSSQSEQDTSECTTAHSGTTTDRRSRSRSRRISLRKKLKLPIGMFCEREVLYKHYQSHFLYCPTGFLRSLEKYGIWFE